MIISSLYLKMVRVSRQQLAKAMDVPYGTIGNWLGGFSPWPEGEMERAERIVEKIVEHREANANS